MEAGKSHEYAAMRSLSRQRNRSLLHDKYNENDFPQSIEPHRRKLLSGKCISTIIFGRERFHCVQTILVVKRVPFRSSAAVSGHYGYEIEKTPEEKLREYYESLWSDYCDSDDPFIEVACESARAAVKETLNLLGIKIEGVND
ncbi:hypothetical protein ACMXZI_15510 [Bacillus subtilis]|uniref:hypothetical protein n=1 Tax=Bacillus subtilis TaxID=1423 RepID=UPI0039E39511